jgi:hypothetical protein
MEKGSVLPNIQTNHATKSTPESTPTTCLLEAAWTLIGLWRLALMTSRRIGSGPITVVFVLFNH